MSITRITLIGALAFGFAGSIAVAADTSNWITPNQAINIAKSAAASGYVPCEVEIDDDDSLPLRWKVELVKGSNITEVKIDPVSGVVVEFDVDNDPDDAAEYRSVINASPYTLIQMVNHVKNQWPAYYIAKVEAEVDNGRRIFDVELIRGATKIQLELDAVNRQVLRTSYHNISPASPLYNLHAGNATPGWNTTGMKNARQMITIAQSRFSNSKAYEIELKRNGSNYHYEVKLLRGNKIVEAKFNPTTGSLISQESSSNAAKVNSARNAINNANISMARAVTLSRNYADGFCAKVELNGSGTRYETKFKENAGWLKVKLRSSNGSLIELSY